MKKINCALVIGRKGSKGFPGKVMRPVLGRPMSWYPINAAKRSKFVNRIFVSTDSPKLKKLAKRERVELIDRPHELTTDKALGEDVFVHGYYEIKKIIEKENMKINTMILLFANAPTITGKLIDQGIKILKKDQSLDSAVTTSVYNMWSPLRARRLDKKKLLKPFVPFSVFGNPKKLNCDRDSQGDVFFADMSVSVVRPNCLEKLDQGLLPQKWMGKKIAPIPSWGGCDVDYEWQVTIAEFWLRKHGFVNKKD
jgi:CMP-N-acetylneuraminic acid synthetase